MKRPCLLLLALLALALPPHRAGAGEPAHAPETGAQSSRSAQEKPSAEEQRLKKQATRRNPEGYKELARLPFACLCAPGSPLAARAQVTGADLAAEPLALLAPYAAPPAVQRVQETLLGEHDPDTLHVCDSTEALTTLVAAGYGAAVLPLPQGPAQPPLARVPFAGAAPVSFGAYYKTTRDRPQLKAFLAAARQALGGLPPAAKGV